MIRVVDLDLSYPGKNGSTQALRGVSFELPRGETCAIIGPSGCGKTSLLYVLAGLLPPTRGLVYIDGQPVQPRRRGTALILQDYGLMPWKTVLANAVLGLQVRGYNRREQLNTAERILRELGLWEFRHHYPAQLSGGQRQRVAIARSLAMEPDLLLMDEPFSSLDALTREALQRALLEIWLAKRITLVLVTHSIEEAVFLGQRILVLSPGPGTIIRQVFNQGAGDPDYRNKPDFHKRCVELRSWLGRGMALEAAGAH